jgi:hypothetical protein
MADNKEKKTILFQMEITREIDDALKGIIKQFTNKPSKRLVAAALLEMAINSGEPIIITNGIEREKNVK